MKHPQAAKIAELMAKLSEVHAQQAETMHKMVKSLALREFYPPAFDAEGGCYLTVSGDLKRNPSRARLGIKQLDTDVVEFPILSVPWILWPDSAKEEYLSGGYGKRKPVNDFERKNHE